MSPFLAVFRDPLCPHLLYGASPPSHGYKHNLHAPIHISSTNLSTKLQVHASAFYPFFFSTWMLSTHLKISISETEHLLFFPQNLLYQLSHPLRSIILDSSISLSFISISSGNVPSDYSHNLITPHKLPFNHLVLSHNILVVS